MAIESSAAFLFAPVLAAAARAGHMLSNIFLRPGSTFSLLSLGFALMVSAAFLLLRRARRHRKRHALRVLIRALFPRWLWRCASTRADIGFFLLNSFVTASLIGWALLSYDAIGSFTTRMLDRTFGSAAQATASLGWREALLTALLFLAYEFSYWIDHFLKHKIPLLWEFHRVHHTAEVLTPLTVFRVHPVDSLIFYNITALIMGVTHGAAIHMLGGATHEVAWSGTNIILVVFVFATVHLQHSHIDIRFGGWLGRLIFSPAHHHIHHSTRPEHFDSNLGSCLAVWDWMFGTLILPHDNKERLKFGVGTEADLYGPHSVSGGLVLPFVRALKALWPRTGPMSVARPALPSGFDIRD